MNRIITNLDLCKVFGVKPRQKFWMKKNGDYFECYVDDLNHFYTTYGSLYENSYKLSSVSNEEMYYGHFYYIKPVELTENTINFLEMINNTFKYIARDKNGCLYCFQDKPTKRVVNVKWTDLLGNKPFDDSGWISDTNKKMIDEEMLDIDLSFIKWEDDEPYLISDLLGDDE